MASKRDGRRERLFDLYAAHHALYRSDLANIFVCPLCPDGIALTRRALTTLDVGLAHVLPKALGGTTCVLACNGCNNGVGRELESALAHWLDERDWSEGIGKKEVRLSGSFGDIAADWEMSATKKDWSFYGRPAQTNPLCLDQLDSYVRSTNEAKFSVSWNRGFQPKRVEVALYHSALLVMFHYFGYEFLFHPNYSLLRAQVRQPDEDIWKTRWISVPEAQAAEVLQGRRQGVAFLYDPRAVLVFLKFRSRAKRERVFAVVLPGLDGPPAAELQGGKLSGATICYSEDALLEKWGFAHTWRDVYSSRASHGPKRQTTAVISEAVGREGEKQENPAQQAARSENCPNETTDVSGV